MVFNNRLKVFAQKAKTWLGDRLLNVAWFLHMKCISGIKNPVLILAFLVIPTMAWPAVYYVDCNSANDNGIGTSPNTAWKTIAKVNSSEFSSDDQILFNKGCTWREQLTIPSSGTSGHPIVFGAYGTGANPIMKGSDIVTGWVGAGNKYFVSATSKPDMVYFDGVHGTPQSSEANLTADGRFYYDTSGRILYVYSFSPPSGRLIEATNRAYGISTNGKNYITIKNFSLQHTKDWGAGVLVSSSQYITVDSCDLSNNFYAGFVGSGVHGYMTVINCTIADNGGPGINSFTFTGNVDIGHNLYTRNTIRDNVWRDIQGSGIIGGSDNTEASYNTVYKNGNGGVTHASLNHGIYFAGDGTSIGQSIHHNTVYGHQKGVGLKLVGSGSMYNNLVYNNNYAGLGIGQNRANNVTVNVFYNIAYGNLYGFQELLGGTGTITLNVYNNVFYRNTNNIADIWTADFDLADDVMLTYKNNVMGGDSDYHHNEFLAPSLTRAIIDYNLYEFGNTYYSKNNYPGHGTWAGWQGLGFDIHGKKANPNFIDAAGNDFHLLSTSPAIDAGTDVGLAMDYDGQPIKGLPDIGAFEYGTSRKLTRLTGLSVR